MTKHAPYLYLFMIVILKNNLIIDTLSFTYILNPNVTFEF